MTGTRKFARRAGIVVGAGALIIGAVFATPAQAGVINSTINCQYFGSVNSAGKIAGHCAAVTDDGRFVAGQGYAWCEYYASHTVTACRGIYQVIEIVGLQGGDQQAEARCGSFGGLACPSGEFINPSPVLSLQLSTGCRFETRVTTKIVQTSGTTENSNLFYSHIYTKC